MVRHALSFYILLTLAVAFGGSTTTYSSQLEEMILYLTKQPITDYESYGCWLNDGAETETQTNTSLVAAEASDDITDEKSQKLPALFTINRVVHPRGCPKTTKKYTQFYKTTTSTIITDSLSFTVPQTLEAEKSDEPDSPAYMSSTSNNNSSDRTAIASTSVLSSSPNPLPLPTNTNVLTENENLLNGKKPIIRTVKAGAY
ncbi:unnamed protein product [Didymodactylos carnosus]|uniref:Uncharacterized protein n=1 Tax=Didymodactylos carnosus TaxID=1234261 RepID=A0A814N346_9BILA|nr:unnamed protein product [Didymodactylos carnosus]CAF1087643.1 unnamed protein product [Didymodactylos carnosus]CAF3515004.1 unnamed protein product [Didymodactylos carnosus]CAF3853177.1 unnamed protein product [Didymodactylos carnosus]